MENSAQNFIAWLNRSLTVKMVVVGILILILLIPLAFVQSLIGERAQRQKEVIGEINQKWGKENTFSGLILKIPYTKNEISTYMDSNSKETKQTVKSTLQHAYFLPEKFEGKSNLQVKKLKRNIYESAVYEGNLTVSGILGNPDFKPEDIPEENIQWDKASLILQTSNLKGIKNQVYVEIGGRKMILSPKYSNSKIDPGQNLNELESEHFDFRKLSSKTFNFKIEFNGSEGFNIIPIAKETKLNVKSNWASPSFTGEYLPKNESEKVTDNGFDANWNVLYYNRPFTQSFFEKFPDLKEYSFGVNLLVPVDEYAKSERSAKYGYLVIAFTFLFFFLIQATSKINIHPFQYLLVGLALVMFYTLLISISEHSSFLKAYLIAGSSVIGLITLYSVSVLKKIKSAFVLAIALTCLYTFIFIIIQLENYALLVGSIGLFIILAIVMYVSRKIEWK
jgi:inner membrane protein